MEEFILGGLMMFEQLLLAIRTFKLRMSFRFSYSELSCIILIRGGFEMQWENSDIIGSGYSSGSS